MMSCRPEAVTRPHPTAGEGAGPEHAVLPRAQKAESPEVFGKNTLIMTTEDFPSIIFLCLPAFCLIPGFCWLIEFYSLSSLA